MGIRTSTYIFGEPSSIHNMPAYYFTAPLRNVKSDGSLESRENKLFWIKSESYKPPWNNNCIISTFCLKVLLKMCSLNYDHLNKDASTMMKFNRSKALHSIKCVFLHYGKCIHIWKTKHFLTNVGRESRQASPALCN